MGGKMFEGTSPVPKDQVQAVVQQFIKNTKLTDARMIGSTGKKDLSHDIDLGTSVPIDELITMIEKTGYEFKKLSSGISVLYPFIDWMNAIDVQVDIISGDQNFLDLYYYADPMNSEYSGAERNMMISAVTRSLRVQTTEDNEIIQEIGPVWTPSGLQFRKKFKDLKKNGSRAKTFKIEHLSDNFCGLNEIQSILFGLVTEHDIDGPVFRYPIGKPEFDLDMIKTVESIRDSVLTYLSPEIAEKIQTLFQIDLENSRRSSNAT